MPKFQSGVTTFPTTVTALDGSGLWTLVADIDQANGNYVAQRAAVVQGLAATPIDSSAGAIAETLAASSNTGVVRLFANVDVSNTATLTVQSGETLNGAVDGSFLFSNYSAGTQFRADEVAGGWVVSVVGASATTNNVVVLDHTTEVTLVSGSTTLVFNEAPTTNGRISINGLTYFDQGALRYVNLDFSLFDDDQIVIDLGSAIPPEATIDFVSYVHDGNENQGARAMAFNHLGGSQFYVNKDNGLDGINGRVTIVLSGVASGQVVLAGNVTPQELGYLVAVRSGSVTQIDPLVQGDAIPLNAIAESKGSNISFNTSTSTFTLKAGSSYRLTADLAFTASGNQFEEQFQFYNVTDSSLLGTWGHYKDFTGDSSPKPSNPIAYLSPSVDTDVILTMIGNLDDDISNLQIGSWVEVREVPGAQVVLPDALPVEDTTAILSESTSTNVPSGTATVDIEWDSPSLDSGGFTTTDNITFTCAIADTYDFSGFLKRTGAQDYIWFLRYTPNGGSQENLLETASPGLGNVVGTSDGTNGGNFNFVKAVQVGDTFKFSIRADAAGVAQGSLHIKKAKQKTVINSKEIPVQNQENQVDGGVLRWNATTSAYEPYSGSLGDIVEFGSGNTVSGPGSVTFAAAQPDTNYRLFVEAIGGGNGQVVNVTAKTTTGFSVFGVDVNGAARTLSFDWMIIRRPS